MIRFLFFFFFISFSGAFFLTEVFSVKATDREEYERLFQTTAQKKREEAVSYFSKLNRTHGTKELWWEGPNHLRLECDRSELLITKGKKERLKAIEKLEKIHCLLEEGLQEVRVFDAERGSFNYALREFEAEEIAMKHYRINDISQIGALSTLTPFSTGKGDKLIGTWVNHKVRLEMDTLHTTFTTKKDLTR